MTGTIQVDSGVSWLHDHLRVQLEEREQQILEVLGRGLDYPSYIKTTGMLQECKRQIGELQELFQKFYQDEEEDDG